MVQVKASCVPERFYLLRPGISRRIYVRWVKITQFNIPVFFEKTQEKGKSGSSFDVDIDWYIYCFNFRMKILRKSKD
jgi:hypothetical protein